MPQRSLSRAVLAAGAMLASSAPFMTTTPACAQACDPDTGPGDTLAWFASAKASDDPWKYCTSPGFFYGTVCFQMGATFSCGSSTLEVGDSFEVSGGVAAGGFSASVSSTHSVSQGFTCDATNNKRCAIWVCYKDTVIRNWSCLRYIFWGSYDNSYTTFSPGAPSLHCCCKPAACTPEMAEPDAPIGGMKVIPSGGVAGEMLEGRNSILIDLATHFTPLAVPPPGHPLSIPTPFFPLLTKWHLVQIQATSESAGHAEDMPIEDIVIADADGTGHHFLLDSDPFPFWGEELTQSSSMTIEPSSGVACYDDVTLMTLATSIARSYDLSTIPGIAGMPYTINGVVVGIETNTGSNLVGSVNIYLDTDGGPPVASGADLMLLASRAVLIADDHDLKYLTAAFDAPIVVPADSTIVVELTYPDHVDGGIWPGCNDDGQSGPTYILSTVCGLPAYVDLASIGFPDAHFVQTIVGPTPIYSCMGGAPANDCAPDAFAIDADDSVAFSNVGATTDGPDRDCPYGADVWYMVELPAEGVLTVALTSAAVDSTLAFYDLGASSIFDPNDLPSLALFNCVDGFGVGSEIVSLPRRASGTHFLIQAAGYDGGAGPSTGVGTLTTSFERTIFDTRANAAVMWDADTTVPPVAALTNLGWSSGNLSAAFPQRWSAQAFTVPDPGAGLAWRATELHAFGFTPAGVSNATFNWIVFERSGMSAPIDGDQVASGTAAFPSPIEALDGSSSLEDHGVAIDLPIAPGSYWLTVYASNASGGATPANFAWFTNAPEGINNLVGGAPFAWRSAMFPIPGFVAYTVPATSSLTQFPGLDVNDLYNAAFRISGALESTALPCPADFNLDGKVDGADLSMLLGSWGPAGLPFDLNGDGVVDGAELAILLGAWGPCPL